MKFGAVPLEEAEGKILGHNIAGPDGRRALRKGNPLTAEQIETLRNLGRTTVYVATLQADDVDEDTAAGAIATAAAGEGIRLSGSFTGRVNLYAQALGLVRVDVARLHRLNTCDGVTLATLPTHTATRAGKMVATMKILPYAIPQATVAQATQIAAAGGPLIHLDALPPRAVGLILSATPPARERTVRSFKSALEQRLEPLDATIESIDFVPLEDESGEVALAQTIRQQQAAGIELIILAGETAIMDRHDITPRAVERAGGEVVCFGAPVDPGNLLMVAYLGETPVLGAPGCARSPKDNIIDLVLPRLLAADRLTHDDIIAWGHGGLLEDVPERPMPRSRLT